MPDAVFLINSLLLGVGLAMDAFSVSIVNGLGEPAMSGRRRVAIAGVYAAFQFVMPLAGFFLTSAVMGFLGAARPVIPWLSLILLSLIGGSMIREGRKGPAPDPAAGKTGAATLVLQGLVTSIDALSVGLAFSDRSALSVLISAFIIGGVTFVICFLGLVLGRRLGALLSGRAQIVGGVILIGIGIEIFIRGVAR